MIGKGFMGEKLSPTLDSPDVQLLNLTMQEKNGFTYFLIIFDFGLMVVLGLLIAHILEHVAFA